MNEDKILHCLLTHKSIKSEAEQGILAILAKNNISSGKVEKDHCLERGLLVVSRYQIENSLGGICSSLQTSVSSLGETDIRRLWDKCELNPNVERKKKRDEYYSKLTLPILVSLIASILLGMLVLLLKWLSPTMREFLP